MSPSTSLEPRRFCYRCHKAAVTCVCASVPQVSNRTAITILQHPHERFHSIGTVRFAKLGLRRVRIDECAPWQPNDEAISRIPADAALLYPARGAVRLSDVPAADRPEHLVVIDGTWFQAKKIYDAHPGLHRLPAIAIEPPRPSTYRIRREPKRDYLSTIEAVAAALQILEPDTDGVEDLLASFRAMIDRQLAYCA